MLFVAIAILCAACRTDTLLDPVETTPTIDAAEISAREDCLYREVARLLEPKGSPPKSLHNIAVSATRFCSQAVTTRLERASKSARDAPVIREVFRGSIERIEKHPIFGTIRNRTENATESD